ncbi:hypothetical protein DSO57_1013917 [Entomophthora muscae]|uniref:Uncharacterized protein n=1 Tax=Entomophthora muscae TaxID=34485 RepID=A0ACC2UEZ7_9FUNG|nr:hypothetical protein DSO57_1013917 [Entomophthora muscae]
MRPLKEKTARTNKAPTLNPPPPEADQDRPEKAPTAEVIDEPMEPDPVAQTTTPPPSDRREGLSTSPDRRGVSTCSSRPRSRGRSGNPRAYNKAPTQLSATTREILGGKGITEDDIQAWYDLTFTLSAILRWHNSGFSPSESDLWEREGFSSHAAVYWKEANIPLEWANPMRKMGVRTKETLEWIALGKHQAEVTQAVKAKLPLATAKEWKLNGFNLYEAT